MSTLLDTKVLSEVLRAQPDTTVLAWLAAQPAETLFVSAVTQAEMLLGARLLPASNDSAAAFAYAGVVELRRTAGRPISQFDAQIAAIALSRRAVLATRNVPNLESCGVALRNPWESTGSAGVS